MASRIPHINYRVLTVFIIVAMPLLAIGAVAVLATGQARLRDSYGLHLAQVAEHTVAAVDAYVFRRIIDVSILGRVPVVRETASGGSRQPLDIQAVRQIDQEWRKSHTVPPALSGLLATACSRFLGDIVQHDPAYREILLTDRQGRLVAASNVATDFYQADEDWWREAYDDGVRGRVSVSDVRWDESARVFALEIAVPVAEPTGDNLTGILKVAADAREMLAAISAVQLGATGEAVLLRADSSIVLGRRPLDPGARYFAADLLRERLQTVKQGDLQTRIHFDARAGDGSQQLIGVATSQLGVSYPHLSWLLAVSQSENELFGPVRELAWYLILLLGGTVIAVLAAATWFSMRLAAPPVDIDMHLVEHARLPPLEDEAI